MLPPVNEEWLEEQAKCGAEAATPGDGLAAELEDLKDFQERIDSVIPGTVNVKFPDWAEGSFRNGEPPYDPDLNDGVRVNLLPIQMARLLPVKRIV